MKPLLILGLLALMFLLGVATGHAIAAERCVDLTVRPQVWLKGGDIDIKARVRPHADHRWLVVSWESDRGTAGSRTLQLEGDHERVLFQWWEKNYPAGNYVFDAAVYNAQHELLGREQQTIRTAAIEDP